VLVLDFGLGSLTTLLLDGTNACLQTLRAAIDAHLSYQNLLTKSKKNVINSFESLFLTCKIVLEFYGG